MEGELLYKGAEADLIRGEWQGLEAVYKVRRPLVYRLPILDEAIRRHRTIREAEMIHSAKRAGVPSPHLYAVDVAGSTIVMEYVSGERVRDLVKTQSKSKVKDLFLEYGRDAGLLHRSGMMHGDLTTANVVRRDESLVFVDFGLSIRTSRLEDHAVDLRLIKETLVGAHPEKSAAALESLYEGYAAVVGPTRFRSTIGQLKNIEGRGRYARIT